MSRMPAQTTCFTSARARTAIAPNPLEAPVTRTTFGVLTSDHPSVGVDDLAVDPPGGACQEGDGLSDVIGLAEPFQRGRGLRAVDDLLGLALEIQRCRGRPRRDGVDGHVVA